RSNSARTSAKSIAGATTMGVVTTMLVNSWWSGCSSSNSAVLPVVVGGVGRLVPFCRDLQRPLSGLPVRIGTHAVEGVRILALGDLPGAHVVVPAVVAHGLSVPESRLSVRTTRRQAWRGTVGPHTRARCP